MITTKSSYYSRRRYSNWDPNTIGPPSVDDVDPTLTGGGSSAGGSSSGSGWDWGQFNNTLGIVGNAITSIFSPSSKWQNQTNSQLYQQERRTNTILWVIIGLMAAMGVVLLFRKTK